MTCNMKCVLIFIMFLSVCYIMKAQGTASTNNFCSCLVNCLLLTSYILYPIGGFYINIFLYQM